MQADKLPVTAYVYVDTALGALNRRNQVRRLSEVDFRDDSPERYISHRRATVALLEWVQGHQNANGNPTIEGFDGEVWDPSLPFDFDDRHDPAHALEWVRQFFERLRHADVPLDALRLYFSGAKGFHVEIPHTLFGGFEPSTELHVWERRAALELMHGIPFDTAVYDKLRLWRLPNTLNAKGNHYKVQLSVAEVLSLSMDEILTLASATRARLVSAPDEEWVANDYLVEVWQRARGLLGDADNVEVVRDEPHQIWSDARRDQTIEAATIAVIAANWPTEAGLSRHSDYLLPLSGFLAQHMEATVVAEVLKEAALRAGDKGFLEDRTRHWQEEIDRLALGAATKITDNQKVEGLPTVARYWPELAELLSTLYVVRIRSLKEKTTPKSTGFTFTLLKDLLAEPPEETAFLVDGMLPTAGISLWGAKPKTGKSVAARNLAMSISRGEPFLGRECRRGAVLVLALEEKRAEVANHFRDMGGTNELVHIHTGAAPATSREGIADLAKWIAIVEPVLVVVDPVLKLVRVKDSSDYAELTRELEPIIELARNTGCHIAVTHHLGKQLRDGGDDVLGSTAIFGAVDTLVILRRGRDDTRVMHTVQRYGKDMPETTVPLDEFSGRIALGSAISELQKLESRQAVIELLKGSDGVDQQTVRKEAGVASQHAYQALVQLHKEGLVERSGAGRAGDPYRYRLAPEPSEKSCFLVFSTSSEKQENNRNSQPLQSQNGGANPEAAEKPKNNSLSLCRACGQVLSETEMRTGFALHFDCTLPFEEGSP
jgi:hypothetical protein